MARQREHEGSPESTVGRRGFLIAAGAAAMGLRAVRALRGEEPPVSCRPVTSGPRHHFFGYYDKCPWSDDGRYLLAGEVDFVGRQPTAEEELTLGVVDLEREPAFRPFARTTAWCWQQGAMLRWLPGKPPTRVIYNVRREGSVAAETQDLETGTRVPVREPIYDVSPDGNLALSLSFGRLAWTRPGYGYEGAPDPWKETAAPADEGVRVVDLRDGASRLVASLEKLSRFQPKPEFPTSHHWVNHLLFSPDGGRFIFLHRWGGRDGWRATRLFTADPDGGNLRLLLDHGMVSHFIWRDPSTILVWARHPSHGDAFYHVDDRTGEARPFAKGVLGSDGHCSYSPDRKWVLVDTYPDRDRMQHLYLVRASDEKRIELGAFRLPPELKGPWRCDLHPRWSRDGARVCIDSAHEPTRQVYVLDVRGITEPRG